MDILDEDEGWFEQKVTEWSCFINVPRTFRVSSFVGETHWISIEIE